jgi:hypothetical protein
MTPLGRAALTRAMESAWQSLLAVRDDLKDEGMGILAARVTRLCSELDDLRAVLAMGGPDPDELAGPVADALAGRATSHAQRALGELDLVGIVRGALPSEVSIAALTNTVASAFLIGYGACVDDSKPAKTVFRARRVKR